MNPITQRSSYSQQNGNMAQKQNVAPKPTSKESNTPDNHAHDRLVFLVTSFIVRLSTRDPAEDDALIRLRD